MAEIHAILMIAVVDKPLGIKELLIRATGLEPVRCDATTYDISKSHKSYALPAPPWKIGVQPTETARELTNRNPATARGSMRISAIWNAYEASPIYMRETSERRRNDVKTIWQEFAKAYWSRPASKITSDMVADWLAVRTAGLSPKTYNEYLRIVRQVIGGILSKTGLACNPALEVPVKRNASVSRKPYTKEQVAKITAVVEGGVITIPYHYRTHGRVVTVDRPYTIPYNMEVRDTIWLGFWCGLRLSDAVAVTADQYDDGFLTYCPIKTRVSSGKEVTVPVLHEPLKRRLEELDGDLTPNLRKLHRQRPSDLCRLYRRIFEACGITTQADRSVGRRSSIYGFHALRHGFVSMMCNAGVDLNICSEMVGHTSPITTRVYNHVSKSRLLNEAAKVIVS